MAEWQNLNPRDSVDDLPDVIEIEPTYTCNLRCRMCHVSYMSNDSRPVFDVDLIEKLSPLTGRFFILGAEYEPMMNRHFGDLIRKLTAIRGKLTMITNGTLIDGETLDMMADADFRHLTFSFDGIRKETYEHIRRRANHGQAVERILKTRERFKGRDTFFAVNSTMMRRNMDEIDEMVDFWDGAGFDALRMITMVARAFDRDLIRESLFPVRAAFFRRLDEAAGRVIRENRNLSLHHPYYRESPLRQRYPDNIKDGHVKADRALSRRECTPRVDYSLGHYKPGIGFPCQSPWKHVRIKADGTVELCYRYTVGNLRESSFEEIWYGEKAALVRHAMLTSHARICTGCDYYRFCLNAGDQKVNDLQPYFAVGLLATVDDIDFEKGAVRPSKKPASVTALLPAGPG